MNNRRQNNHENMHFPCTFPLRHFPPNNHQNNSPNSPPSAHQNEILPQNSPRSCSLQNAPEFLGTSPDQECLKSTPSPAFQCCTLCGQFIVDTHLAKIFPDRLLHENCARCSICNCQFLASPSTLSANCFEREGRFFCRMHYLQCFPPPPSAAPPTLCAGCGTAIEAADLVYKLKASIVFHVRCHRCVHCGCQLGQGQQIVVDERSKAVACAIHFEGNALAEMIAENQSRIGEELFPGNEGNGQQRNAPLGIQGVDLATGQNAGPDFGVPNGIVEQMQKEAQIGQQMANAQQRLFDAAQQMADEGMLGGEGMAMSCQNELAPIMPNQSTQANSQIGQSQQSSPISLHFPPPPLQNIQQFCHQILPQNGQQQQIHQQAENVVGIFDCQQQNLLGEREEGEGNFVGGSGIGRENGHQEEMGQNIGGGNKKKKSLSSSPAACTKSNQPSSSFLDGIVLTTVQNIKAAVGAAVENRQKDGGGEEEEEGAGKKKKEKIGATIHRRTSSGAGSSTTPPAPIVPQYPFEMYAAGEQFSRQEEEFQQNGQGNKRRGPRTTISQQQLDILNRIFTTTPKPTKHARAKLAMDAGLSMRVIQVWFQNRRSKERRLKHLCNFLRHCDGGAGGGDGQNQMLESSRMEEDEEDEGGEGNDGIGGRIMLVKEEERSEFDERAEAIEGLDSVGAEFCC